MSNKLKLLSLSGIIAMAQETYDAKIVQFKVRKFRSQGDIAITKIDEELNSIELKILETIREFKDEFNFDTIIDMKNKHALLLRKREMLQSTMDELFAEDQKEEAKPAKEEATKA